MRLIKYLSVNAVFAVLIYLGLVNEINGALNVALFMAWFTVFCGFMSLTDVMTEELQKKGRVVPFQLDITFDVIVAAAFSWHGYWVIAALYLLSSFLMEGARNRKLEVKPELTEI